MSNIDNIEPPIIKDNLGSIHPINQVKEHLLKMLFDLGFQEVDGPEIESEDFNFDMRQSGTHANRFVLPPDEAAEVVALIT